MDADGDGWRDLRSGRSFELVIDVGFWGGEIVPVDKGRVLVLETAKLRVDMQVINFSYAAGTPSMSHFNSLTVEFTVLGK